MSPVTTWDESCYSLKTYVHQEVVNNVIDFVQSRILNTKVVTG